MNKYSDRGEYAMSVENQVQPDIGYNNIFWMKVLKDKVIGFGDVEGINGTLVDVETWVFNEFCKEAIQFRTKAVNFKTSSQIKSLNNLKKDINEQIKILKEHNKSVKKTYSKTNKKLKKSIKSKGVRATRKNKK